VTRTPVNRSCCWAIPGTGKSHPEREGRSIGTNLPVSEWGSVFPDPRLVAAIVDRVTFNAHILETGTESYRLRSSKNSSRGKRASRPDLAGPASLAR
jgi:IstB-like ATP binding protein